MIANMAVPEVEAVGVFRTYLDEMLTAAGAKPRIDAIEPPIQKADIAPVLQRLDESSIYPAQQGAKKTMQYAIIETAVRDAFVALLVRDDLTSTNTKHIDRADSDSIYYRQHAQSTHPPSSRSGISSMSSTYSATTRPATQPCYSGSSKS